MKTEPIKNKSDFAAPFFVIIAASLWGVDGIVLTPGLYSLPVTLVVFIESLVVALLLLPFLSRQLNEISNLQPRDWLAFLAVGLFGGAIGTMTITKALFYVNYVNLSIVILIQKLQPVFAIGMAALFLKERLPKEFFVWAALAIIGAYLMTFGFNLPVMSTGDKTAMAALFALFAAISFGSSTVFSKRALKNVSFETGTFLRFAISSVVMLVFVLASGTFSSVQDITEHQVVIFIIIALTTGGPAIFLYYYGLKKISASVASICELSFPLTAVILEYLIRGNILNWIQWAGVAVLFFSIVRVTRIRVYSIE
ncbi:MAG: DMT family transporter [Ignavibacteriaceae bacterium]